MLGGGVGEVAGQIADGRTEEPYMGGGMNYFNCFDGRMHGNDGSPGCCSRS